MRFDFSSLNQLFQYVNNNLLLPTFAQALKSWVYTSLAGQTLSASGRGSGDIPILELCRHAGIFPA